MKSQQSKIPPRPQVMNATMDTLHHLVTLRLAAAVTRWIEFQLTFAQLKALLVLSQRGELTLGELAQVLGTGNSATSILVQQMVARGLVDRAHDPDDRRRTVLCLSERGATLVAGRRKEREVQLGRWLAPLSDEELQGLQHGLALLHDAMQEELGHAA
ncbi:MAG: MarR family winged helix-turn-helix transcriptional regulator [Acidobacteriota bacterium]